MRFLGKLLLRFGARLNRPTLVLRALAWNAPVDMVYGGRSVLQTATYFGNEDVVEVLIDHQANADFQIEGIGSTALHLAADRGHVKIMERLLRCGADPNVRNSHGSTPLHLAMLDCNPIIVATLLRGGADPNVQDHSGNTALHQAYYKNRQDIVSLLMQHGANPDIQDEMGRDPRFWSVSGT